MEVQGAMAGHSYTLRLYHNQSHGASGPGRAVTAVSVNPFPDPPHPHRAPAAAPSPSPGSHVCVTGRVLGEGPLGADTPGLGDTSGGQFATV